MPHRGLSQVQTGPIHRGLCESDRGLSIGVERKMNRVQTPNYAFSIGPYAPNLSVDPRTPTYI